MRALILLTRFRARRADLSHSRISGSFSPPSESSEKPTSRSSLIFLPPSLSLFFTPLQSHLTPPFSLPSIITGVAILRGKDAKLVLDVAPDFDSYDVKELDLEKKEDRDFFEGALAWDLKVGDKEWVDGKVVSSFSSRLVLF